jgi:hypothetical protein
VATRCAGTPALAAARLEQARVLQPLQQDRQEPLFGLAREEPRAEGVEHGAVEADIGELQTEQVLPIAAPADRIGGLAIGQPCEELEDRHHREAPGALGRLATGGEEVGEVPIGGKPGELVAQLHGERARGEGGPRDAAGLLGDRGQRWRVVGHGTLLGVHYWRCSTPGKARSLP